MTADQALVAALGLDGAVVIDREEYERLPEHRRDVVHTQSYRGTAYLRLPDPPAVAALREIALLTSAEEALSVGRRAHEIAAAALAEFDGASS